MFVPSISKYSFNVLESIMLILPSTKGNRILILGETNMQVVYSPNYKWK